MEILETPSRSYWQHLWRVELAVAGCLAIYGLLLAALIWAGAAVFAPALPGIDGAGSSFAVILWFGAIPSIVFFAPTYALARRLGFANLVVAVVLGIVCSLVFARSGALALFAMPCGVFVAVAAHLVLERVR